MKGTEERILATLEFPSIREILMRYCRSSLGRNVAGRLSPLSDIGSARRALRQVSEMEEYLLEDRRLSLAGAGDARGIIDHALEANQSIEPHGLYAVGALLNCAREMKLAVGKGLEDKPELKNLLLRIPDLEDIEAELKRTVDAKGSMLSTASPRLLEIRERIDMLSREIRKLAESYLQNKEVARYLQETHYTFRNNRVVLPVRAESRRRIKGILHGYSSSGNTVFLEPEDLVERQNLLEKKRQQESREITRILWEKTRRLIDAKEEVLAAQRIVAWVDFTEARARYALEGGFILPALIEQGPLVLHEARHPLLFEMAFRRSPGAVEEKREAARKEVVPCNLHLGDRFDVLVITGPNTGGKTVTLKTAGLVALMAASGLHVPADLGTVIPFYRAVRADIGGGRDLFQSLSTFSSHIKRIGAILEGADASTLVLLDELGSGTDPLEGEALGRSILKFLLARGARVIVSTHLSKLKEFAFSTDRVENGSVEFDPESLRPTFRLRIGIPGESNALKIAKRLGLPDGVIEEAVATLEIKDGRLSALMDDLQRIRIQTEKDLEEARRESRTVQKLRERTEKQERELSFRRSVLEEEGEREIDQCLRKARDDAMIWIRQLKNLPASFKEPVLELERILCDMLNRTPLGIKRRRYVESLKKGDLVYIPRYRERCRVIKLHKKEDLVEVAYKNLAVKVLFDEVVWPHWF